MSAASAVAYSAAAVSMDWPSAVSNVALVVGFCFVAWLILKD